MGECKKRKTFIEINGTYVRFIVSLNKKLMSDHVD